MSQTAVDDRYFQTERVWKILLRIAPPVMLAQLIQALYNIVDSYFVGQYSNSGLTALSVIFPVQLIITAIAVGTGVGVNTYMARMYAFGKKRAADCTAGTGMVLAVISWAVFAAAALLLMEPYVRTSATSSGAVADAVLYGNIVCVGSLGIFLESIWTKVHQAGGNMRLPMLAQIAGALTNIVLDPILIFGLGPVPRMGIAGAAIATVVGQCVAAVITGISGFRRPPKPVVMRKYVRQIYRLGYPSIFMQMLYTVYIMALNMILAGFSDDAVTVLGLYYKLQSFFFIPLNGLQTCIVPILSYNFACLAYDRCKRILYDSCGISLVFMLVGVVSFECIPGRLIGLFSQDPAVAGHRGACLPYHRTELYSRCALPDAAGVFSGHRSGGPQPAAVCGAADLLSDSPVLDLFQDQPGGDLVCLSSLRGHHRQPGGGLLPPAAPAVEAGGADGGSHGPMRPWRRCGLLLI